MNFKISMLVSTTVALAATFTTAIANAETLTVAGFGATFEKIMREEVIPKFEKENGVTITYTAGNSTGNLAKVVAQKGNQQIDVLMLDDGPMRQAVALGLCNELDESIYADLFPSLPTYGGKAVAIGTSAVGLMYNAKWYADNNVPAPTSWEDLKGDATKGKVVFPPLENGFGLAGLIAIAYVNGGSESNMDPAFTAFEKDYSDKVAAFAPTPADMDQLFQTGQAVLSVNGNTRAAALAKSGFPVAFVMPKEGARSGGMAACAVSGAGDSKAAQALIKTLVSSETQASLAAGFFSGPVNATVKLDPSVAKNVPYGPEQVDALKQTDWTIVNEKRPEWTKRFNRMIQQ